MFDNKKVIIFNLDGTLINSINMWNEIDKLLIDKLSDGKVRIDNIGKLRDKILESCSSSDIYVEYCDKLKQLTGSDLSKEEIDKIRFEMSIEYSKENVKYKENADKLLKLLKENGYSIVLATTTSKIQLDIYRKFNKNIIEKANIDDIFDLILTKDDVINKKPNPEVYNKILERLNVTKEECIIIEDSLIGVKAAKNSGIEVAVIYDENADYDRDEINRLCDYKFDNYDQIIKLLEISLKKCDNDTVNELVNYIDDFSTFSVGNLTKENIFTILNNLISANKYNSAFELIKFNKLDSEYIEFIITLALKINALGCAIFNYDNDKNNIYDTYSSAENLYSLLESIIYFDNTKEYDIDNTKYINMVRDSLLNTHNIPYIIKSGIYLDNSLLDLLFENEIELLEYLVLNDYPIEYIQRIKEVCSFGEEKDNLNDNIENNIRKYFEKNKSLGFKPLNES